ncbi:hypothetical protein [Zemynaea arenosa]|uniref:hypothetical protein n=1 Tax=Zemynaea arenosa TaxID=2561931 RepID=UPI001430E2F7|nr:hypothetical protein [Massilia arenosa]
MKIRFAASALVLALAAAPSFATPVMEMRAQDLLMMAPDLKKSLNLTPNQHTLWQQVEGKTQALLRARAQRHQALQQAALKAAQTPKAELRELVPAIDSEEQAMLAENRQIREWWLAVNDALDDTQRQAVLNLLAEQLQKAGFDGPREGGRGERSGGSGPHGGMGGGRRGGGMSGSMGGGLPGGGSGGF